MINIVDNYFYKLKETIDSIDKKEIINIANILSNAKKSGKQIFIMGNGGSASTASHFVCDINKGVSIGMYKKFKVFCLNDNIPTILAYANDIDYNCIFEEQLKNFLNTDDIVIGISGSGNSENIIKAIKYANSKNAITVGFNGFENGYLEKICKYNISPNINDMQIAEDIHIIFTHVLMKILSEYTLNMTNGENNET